MIAGHCLPAHVKDHTHACINAELVVCVQQSACALASNEFDLLKAADIAVHRFHLGVGSCSLLDFLNAPVHTRQDARDCKVSAKYTSR